MKGARRGPQLAMDAVAVAVLCDAASLALPAGVAGSQAPSLSLAGVVLVVLGGGDLHLSEGSGCFTAEIFQVEAEEDVEPTVAISIQVLLTVLSVVPLCR